MSPPVLGTMLALCMLYFFPATDDVDSQPLLSATQVSSHTETIESVCASSDSESSSDTETISVKACLGPMEVRLPDDIKNGGLFAVNARMLALYSDHCDQCKEKFKKDDVIYMWRCRRVSVVLSFHEHCLLIFSEEEDAHHWTTIKVKELLQGCAPEHADLLESLYRVEADLTSLAVWSIDNADEDSGLEGWTEPPPKLRRC